MEATLRLQRRYSHRHVEASKKVTKRNSMLNTRAEISACAEVCSVYPKIRWRIFYVGRLHYPNLVQVGEEVALCVCVCPV